LRKLGTVMLISGGIGILAAALSGWAVATNGLRPVRRLTRSVERNAVTEDLTPVPVGGDDEIARLATAFNQMLGALAASRDRQRRLVADASHELRTPLTSLRTNLDLLAQTEGADPGAGGLPAEARRELLDDVRGQIEELTTLVGDLVMLAREDQPEASVAPLDLAEVTDRAVTRVRRRAPGVDFDVRLEPWPAEGDATGLERAITNLLDNAAKWSPPGGTITVRLASGVLTVDDQGPGIGEADLPHVFERFWRSDDARSMPGSGLGLAIVHQVVDQHGGRVKAGEAPGGGTRMSLAIPGLASV
jgi:two-component system sensor histidine kinase MprB